MAFIGVLAVIQVTHRHSSLQWLSKEGRRCGADDLGAAMKSEAVLCVHRDKFSIFIKT